MALPLAASLVTVMLAYVLHVSYGLFLETRTKRQLASLFGHYVPAALVSEMVKRPEAYTTAVQSRELSIMFCDIQQFTRLAENMAPQQVQAMLNRLFNRIAAIIASNQGTIDKYIGDCVMAFWGAPLPVANHAWLAVKTATDISAMLVEFNAEQIQLGQPPIRLNIGINSGVVSVGDMGSSIRRSYTVLGDAVNVAARLEPPLQPVRHAGADYRKTLRRSDGQRYAGARSPDAATGGIVQTGTRAQRARRVQGRKREKIPPQRQAHRAGR